MGETWQVFSHIHFLASKKYAELLGTSVMSQETDIQTLDFSSSLIIVFALFLVFPFTDMSDSSSSSSSGNEVAVPGEGGEEGLKLGYSFEVDFKYDVDEEFRKPGYAEGPKEYAGSRCGDFEGGFASGSVGRARAVDKDGFSAEAAGPHGFVGSGEDEDGIFAGGAGSVGEAECHAGPVGVGVSGPGVLGTVEAGKRGLNLNSGAKLAEGKVDVGPVKVGAGVGLKGTLRAGYGGVGAIVPGLGGAVVAKDGLELGIGPFNFKIGW